MTRIRGMAGPSLVINERPVNHTEREVLVRSTVDDLGWDAAVSAEPERLTIKFAEWTSVQRAELDRLLCVLLGTGGFVDLEQRNVGRDTVSILCVYWAATVEGLKRWQSSRSMFEAFLHPPQPWLPVTVDETSYWCGIGERWFVPDEREIEATGRVVLQPDYVVPEQGRRGVVQWLLGGVPVQIGGRP